MESVSPNFAAFKEPKAFIKLLQILLAILAFALTTSFSSHCSLDIMCDNNTKNSLVINYSYPFNIQDSNKIEIPCLKQNSMKIVYGNYQSQSQFYVFVGVMTMLYCFGAVILYVFFSEASYQNDRIPKTDFIITLVIAIMWFICSVAWADGVSKLKQYTDIHTIMSMIDLCKDKTKCFNLLSGSYGGLNASLIAGFANVALWAANLWFIFKETLWYERRNPSDQIIGNESVDGGNM